MLTIIAFAIVLSLLVFVHELGHFIIAKRTGVVVEEFAFGYPPRLLKYWQSEGKITLDENELVIGHKTEVSRQVEVVYRFCDVEVRVGIEPLHKCIAVVAQIALDLEIQG